MHPAVRNTLGYLEIELSFRAVSSPLRRSIREGFANVRRPQTEEEEDVNQEEHSESSLQRGHCLRRASGEHRADQPSDRSHGLRPVGGIFFFNLPDEHLRQVF